MFLMLALWSSKNVVNKNTNIQRIKGINIHGRKQTMNHEPENRPLKKRFLLKTIIFRFHVCFWECIHSFSRHLMKISKSRNSAPRAEQIHLPVSSSSSSSIPLLPKIFLVYNHLFLDFYTFFFGA